MQTQKGKKAGAEGIPEGGTGRFANTLRILVGASTGSTALIWGALVEEMADEVSVDEGFVNEGSAGVFVGGLMFKDTGSVWGASVEEEVF